MARRRTRRNVNATSPWPFVGMAGMACAFFLYAASGLVAPWWGVTILLLVWVLLFVVACVWWSLHPRWVPFLAVFAMVFWFAAVTAGGAWLGWTA
ncbi:MAG TPA: hypothetical protein VFT00_04380 [Nocardioides sp.]|nr:hypothetical protein [Nocardioides sp.]